MMIAQQSRREFLRSAPIAAGAWAGMKALAGQSQAGRAEPPSRPNIVLILADDMGFSDPGCYGGEIRTPHLDRLAAGGVRFTQFYNCARCCPTRASLMTGLYPHQAGMALNGQTLGRNGLTIAEALKRAGYNTAMAGKWHLSQTIPLGDEALQLRWLNHRYSPPRPFAPVESYPAHRGFDRHYGVVWGVINHFDPFSLVEGTQAIETVPKDYYFADAITDKSVEYIEEFSRSEKPFFLYLAHCAPHWPLHARPEDIARYRGRYERGWEALRAERYRRMSDMGLFRRETASLPLIQDRGRKWESLSEKERTFEAAKMAVHAAMVDRVDQSVGRILEALERTGRLDNTVILFLADNGASPEIPRAPGFDRNSETRDGRTVRYTGLFDPGSETTYAAIGAPWASASNTPFRYWKVESFEGGCHTPLIIHWPAGLKRRPGSVAEEVGHVMDLMPTCLDLAGTAYPKEHGGHALTPLEGRSLAPLVAGGSLGPREPLFFEHEGGRAIRKGDWKLVATRNGAWELYNLAEDRTETNNLASREADRVRAMSDEWSAWAKRVGAPG